MGVYDFALGLASLAASNAVMEPRIFLATAIVRLAIFLCTVSIARQARPWTVDWGNV